MTDNFGKKIDYLVEDDPISSQMWVCISFLSPEGIRNCSVRGLKIRGAYATKEQADKRAEELQKFDPDFDVFVGEIGKWLPWDPDPNSVADQVYQEKELNDLMKGYKDNLDKAKKMQQQRKTDMIKTAAKEAQSTDSSKKSTKERLQEKLAERKNGKKFDKIAQRQLTSSKEVELKQQEENLKSNEEDLKEVLNETKKGVESKSDSVEDKLLKIQKLYDKLNKKSATATTTTTTSATNTNVSV